MASEQFSIFDFSDMQYKITKPIRLIEFFAGIGAQSKALEVLGANFENYKIAEWSKESIKAYTYIHHYDEIKKCTSKDIINLKGISRDYNSPMTDDQLNRLKDDEKILLSNCIKISHNLVDISSVKGEDLNIVDTDKYEYILTYSFPCQDLSLAGKLAGMKEDSGTRSSLLWQVCRILKECKNKPQILVMENVPEVVGTKNSKDFLKWCKELENMGYANYWEILNAKDYYIPQNRRRCFMVSILGKENTFAFPNRIKPKYYLLDFLEKDVDEKYYLSDKMIRYIMNDNAKWTGNNDKALINKTIASTINTGEGSRRCDASNYISPDLPQNFDLKGNNRLIETHSKIANTITTGIDFRNSTFLLVPENTKKGYAEAEVGDGIYINRPEQKRGVVQKGMIQTIKTSCDDIGVVVQDSMKKELCNKLIESGKVKEGDMIDHSYTNNRLEKIDEDNFKADNENNICKTLTTRCDCLGVVVDVEPKVIGGIGEKKSNSGTQYYLQDRVYDNKIATSICTSFNPYYLTSNLRIRKLTPCECYKLMGFTTDDYNKCAEIQSNATIYHQAGDSIVTTSLIAIFGKLLGVDYDRVIKDYVNDLLNSY